MSRVVDNSRFELVWIANAAAFFVASRNAIRQGSYLFPEPAFADVETFDQLRSRADALERLVQSHFGEQTVMKGVLQQILEDMRVEVRQSSGRQLAVWADVGCREGIVSNCSNGCESPADVDACNDSSSMKPLPVENSQARENEVVVGCSLKMKKILLPRLGKETTSEGAAALSTNNEDDTSSSDNAWSPMKVSPRLGGILMKKRLQADRMSNHPSTPSPHGYLVLTNSRGLSPAVVLSSPSSTNDDDENTIIKNHSSSHHDDHHETSTNGDAGFLPLLVLTPPPDGSRPISSFHTPPPSAKEEVSGSWNETMATVEKVPANQVEIDTVGFLGGDGEFHSADGGDAIAILHLRRLQSAVTRRSVVARRRRVNVLSCVCSKNLRASVDAAGTELKVQSE